MSPSTGLYDDFLYNAESFNAGASAAPLRFVHGRNARFALDSTAGVLVDLSSGLRFAQLKRELDVEEIDGLGDNDRVYLADLREGTLAFEGLFASTYAEILDGLQASPSTASITWQFAPDTTASGKPSWRGEGYLTTLEYECAVDEMVALRAELVVTGAVTSTRFITEAGAAALYNVPSYNEALLNDPGG